MINTGAQISKLLNRGNNYCIALGFLDILERFKNCGKNIYK